MKPKSLVPLVIILVVLAGLVVWKKSSVPQTTIEQQVGLVTLLPDGISKNDIAKLDIYAGEAPDKKLTLAYDTSGDKWLLPSHFNSAVKKDVIDRYLDSIVKIKGEPRATAATESELELYNLSDAKAFHVQGYKKDSAEPYFHLLVGKSPGYNSVFIRKAGSNEVFVEETNLRQQAGVYSDDSRPAPMGPEAKEPIPEPGIWLDKTIVKMDLEKMNKVALTLPDKSLVFERQEKPQAAPPAAEPGTEGTTPPAPAEPAKKEYEWKVASGGPGVPMKENGPKSMTQKLSFLEASDVVDPAKKAEWGLEPAAYVAVVSCEGQPDVRIEGGRPDPNGDGYVTVAGSPGGTVYKVSKFIFEQAFPKGTDVFDLPSLSMDKATIEKIDITQPGGDVSLVKDGESFRIAKPVAALDPQRTTAETLATTLANWKPADYADASADLGEPTRTVTVSGGGQTHTIKLYGPSKHVAGSYARVDDGTNVLVMSGMDTGKIFVKPGDLYVRTLLDIDDMNIGEIAVNGAGGAYSLAHGEDGAWTVAAGGAPEPADNTAAESLAGEVSVLQAEDILFGRSSVEGATETVTVKMKDGTRHVISVGPEKEGKHEVKISGKDQVFIVSAESKKGLFPPVDTLKKPAAPAPAPAPEAPAPAAEAPAAAAPGDAAVAPAPVAPQEVTIAPVPAPVAPQEVTVAPAPAEVTVTPAPAANVPAVEAATDPPADAAVSQAEPAPAPAPTP
ncbi:MAG: DUF4340 domain-containing protein [Candidatus Hydrogenedentes bacterium]|nr:DUF4340 domain-containing protein [Candidatus Hydrogenedentota bacterium]